MLPVKVCGMRDPDNIQAVAELQPEFMGFIFYPPSPRFVGNTLSAQIVRDLPPTIQNVGVFVDAPLQEIYTVIERYGFSFIQLHGSESPEYCIELREKTGVSIIKARSISSELDLQGLTDYIGVVHYLLFDTKTPAMGGSGQQFDWNILTNYQGKTPFFLSGGIAPVMAEIIGSFQHPALYALDVNSRFELRPGVKNPETLKPFLDTIRQRQ